MITKAKKDGVVGGYPSVFNSLVGKKLLFKIETKYVSISQYDGTYKVKRVCDDDTIVAIFQLPGAEMTPSKEFSSQVLDEIVCLGFAEPSGNVRITPAKRNLEEAMMFVVNAPSAKVLKVVKIEKS